MNFNSCQQLLKSTVTVQRLFAAALVLALHLHKITELFGTGISKREIAKQLGISRTSVRRLLTGTLQYGLRITIEHATLVGTCGRIAFRIAAFPRNPPNWFPGTSLLPTPFQLTA